MGDNMTAHVVTITWRDNPEVPTKHVVEYVRFEGAFVLLMFAGKRIEAYPAQDIKSVYINE